MIVEGVHRCIVIQRSDILPLILPAFNRKKCIPIPMYWRCWEGRNEKGLQKEKKVGTSKIWKE